jgi:uncharacterized protein Yka (UPF0111/DUF47 family)
VADVTVKRWFLPDNPDLLGLLSEQATITVEGMGALVEWASGGDGANESVHACEHRADATKRELWRKLRLAYSPPLDAEDLFSLSAQLDEVLNAAKDLVGEMDVMAMAPDDAMRAMVALLADATRHIAEAVTLLTGKGDATARADAAIKCTRRVEHVYRQAMSALLVVPDLREVMGRREAYRRLSRIGGLVVAVAERIWYAVVKEG